MVFFSLTVCEKKSPSDQEDDELVFRIRNGDSEAWEKLFKKYAGKIQSYIFRKCYDATTRDEVAAYTFKNIYEALLSNNKPILKFKSYLYKVAGNTYNEYKRKESKYNNLDSIDEEGVESTISDDFHIDRGSPLDMLLKKENDKNIKRISDEALNNLREEDEKKEKAIRLRFLEGKSIEETAREMKSSAQDIKNWVDRGIQKVRRRLIENILLNKQKDKIILEVVDDTLRSLPDEDQRQAIGYRHIDKFEIEEIAEIMEKKPNEIKKLLKEGIEELTHKLIKRDLVL